MKRKISNISGFSSNCSWKKDSYNYYSFIIEAIYNKIKDHNFILDIPRYSKPNYSLTSSLSLLKTSCYRKGFKVIRINNKNKLVSHTTASIYQYIDHYYTEDDRNPRFVLINIKNVLRKRNRFRYFAGKRDKTTENLYLFFEELLSDIR